MQRQRRNQTGAAMTEYGFLIAFVGVVVAFALMMANGSLFRTVADSKDSCNNALIKLIAASEENDKPAH